MYPPSSSVRVLQAKVSKNSSQSTSDAYITFHSQHLNKQTENKKLLGGNIPVVSVLVWPIDINSNVVDTVYTSLFGVCPDCCVVSVLAPM
jgi:hypothetical protein